MALTLYLSFIADVKNYILIISAMILALSQIVILIADALAFGKQHMQVGSLLGLIASVGWFAFVFILPVSAFSIKVLLLGTSIIQFLRAVIYIAIEWKMGYFIHYDNLTEAENKTSILSQSMPLFGTNISALIVAQLPIIFLGKFSDVSEVGFYGAANKILLPLLLVTQMLFTATYPALSKSFIDDKNKFAFYIRKLFLAVFIVGFGVSLFFSFFSLELITQIFGNLFAPANLPFFIQIWVTLNLILHSFMAIIFLATNNEKTMIKLSLFNAVIIGTSNYIGAHYGAIGLSLSLWCTLLIGFTLHWYFIQKIIPGVLSFKFQIFPFFQYFLLSTISFLFIQTSLLYRGIGFGFIMVLFVVINKSYFRELLFDFKNTIKIFIFPS
jgi:O-antigen/teichoic acid export membrane protein